MQDYVQGRKSHPRSLDQVNNLQAPPFSSVFGRPQTQPSTSTVPALDPVAPSNPGDTSDAADLDTATPTAAQPGMMNCLAKFLNKVSDANIDSGSVKGSSHSETHPNPLLSGTLHCSGSARYRSDMDSIKPSGHGLPSQARTPLLLLELQTRFTIPTEITSTLTKRLCT